MSLAWLLALLALPAAAQDTQGLTGTLQNIRSSGVVTLGYRQASFPFSYAGANGRPLGYAIDLCLAVVDDIKLAIDQPEIEVRYLPVLSTERLPAVKDGRIDLECGSTTNTTVRQKEVAFSPVVFVTGTRLMVRRASGIRSYKDLRNKTVLVSAGTTNAAALQRLSDQQSLAIRLDPRPDLQQAFDAFEAGQADAFATDEVLLAGFLAHAKAPRSLAVVGDLLSFEPYGLVFRKDDPAFAQLVQASFRRLAESRELTWIYDKWFVRPLPGGERLNLRMGPQLTSIFEALGLPPE